MGLMGLVYFIENLTYNGTFFLNIATFLSVILFLGVGVVLCVKFVNNQREPRKVETVLKSIKSLEHRLVEGFMVSKAIGDLVPDTVYVIKNNWPNIEKAHVYPKGMDSCRDMVEVNPDTYSELMVDIKFQGDEEVVKSTTTEEKKINLPKMYLKTMAYLMGVSMILHVLLPTRQTAIYMAAAYAIQEVVTAKKTTNILDKGYVALENQLGKWANEVPEVADMLVGTGIEYTKRKVEEKVIEEVSE